MRQKLIKLGATIKAVRKKSGLTLQELSKKTDLTAGLLSKIENFRTIPSLPVLISVADALNTPPAHFLEDIGGESKPGWILTRASERERIEREESDGFCYEHLLDTESTCENLLISLLTITPNASREQVTTKGDQFIYLISGSLNFILDKETIAMAAGDLLFFDGNIPHVPQNSGSTPAVLLAAYLIHQEA